MTPRLPGLTSAVRVPQRADDDALGGGAVKPDPSIPAPRDHVSVDFSTPGFQPPEDERAP